MLGRSLAAGLVAVLAILLSASCGNEATPAAVNSGDSAVLPAPHDLDLRKQTLVGSDLVQHGSWAGLSHNVQHIDNNDLLLDAEQGDPDKLLAWAMYGFQGGEHFRVDAVQLTLPNYAGNADSTYFVGFADFHSNTWRWQELPEPNGVIGVESKPVTVAVPEGDFYPYNQDEGVIVAVIAYGQPLTIDTITLKIDEAAPPPMNFVGSNGSVLDGVRLTWDPYLATYPTVAASGFVIERRIGDNDYIPIETLEPNETEYFDANAIPDFYNGYRIRTLLDGFPGRPVYASGWVAVRPTAVLEITGIAPDLQLFAGDSFDDDITNVITKYYWKTFLPASPDYVYEFERDSGESFSFTLSDMTQINRFDLQVEDNEGVLSLPAEEQLDAAGFFLWSPNLGCVQDDAGEPDPKELVQGSGPGTYTVGLRFDVSCGNPNYRFELDSHFDGNFGSGPKGANGQFVPSVVLKDFGTMPNIDGPYNITANIPANQSNGLYYMAVRVTDGNGDESVYMWPDKVTLAP